MPSSVELPLHLLPGEVTYRTDGRPLATLLGSCVAVCLHDRRHGWGGMNHFLVPGTGGERLPSGKYGGFAIRFLVDQARRAGSRRGDLRATIVGGGRVLERLDGAGLGGADIGSRNLTCAREELRRLRIETREAETGGEHGRRLFFDPVTGSHRVQQIGRSELPATRSDRRLRVLLVGGSRDRQAWLADALERQDGLRLAGADSAAAARERLLAFRPHALCLEPDIPDVPPALFVARVRAAQAVGLVAIVAQAERDLVPVLQEAGVDAILDREELVADPEGEGVRRRLIPALGRAATAATGRVRNVR